MKIRHHPGVVACLLLAAAVWSPLLADPLTIVEPRADEILYGRTEIVVELEPGSGAAGVVFRLDPLPEPVCRIAAPPYRCTFDAGTQFQSWTIRADALGPGGALLREASVETLAFPRPEQIVRHALTVPVVATTSGDRLPDLGTLPLQCHYSGKPCKVVSAEQLSEHPRYPISLEILVDVSGSVDFDRAETEQALRFVFDSAPVDVEVALAEFGERYKKLSPFTTDRTVLHDALALMSFSQTRTCLIRALDHSLSGLSERPGHRLLFVISDGEDNCGFRPRRGGLAHMDPLYDIVREARENGVPLYIYRFAETGAQPWMRSALARSYEGLARETGGRLFASGTLYGMSAALSDLKEDLLSTWLVDLDLPRVAEPHQQRFLELDPPEESGLTLRYPQYWPADYRESKLLAMLGSEEAEQRGWAVKGLRGRRTPAVTRALLRLYRDESKSWLRQEVLDALIHQLASLLLHGDRTQQKDALSSIETLAEIDPLAPAFLLPALRVYPKTGPLPRHARQAARLLERVR